LSGYITNIVGNTRSPQQRFVTQNEVAALVACHRSATNVTNYQLDLAYCLIYDISIPDIVP
jgi:hypothetical protein